MADTTRTLFDDKSYHNLSQPKMIRYFPQQGCRRTTRALVDRFWHLFYTDTHVPLRTALRVTGAHI